MGARMTKFPEQGEFLITDIAGYYDGVVYGWKTGDNRYKILEFGFNWLTIEGYDEYGCECITKIWTNNKLKWLEEHQVWVLG